MLMPGIFGESLFDDLMDFSFPKMERVMYGGNAQNVMKTDIMEKDSTYEIDIDLPGYRKEDVKAQLKNGYLTIQAEQKQSNDEKDSDGRYIRRERYSGSVSRSFYVGEQVTEKDIHAKFEDGILKLSVPKELPHKVEQNSYIAIEG